MCRDNWRRRYDRTLFFDVVRFTSYLFTVPFPPKASVEA